MSDHDKQAQHNRPFARNSVLVSTCPGAQSCSFPGVAMFLRRLREEPEISFTWAR